MKYYNPNTLQPRSNEFYNFVKDKLSPECPQSPAYKATSSLFSTAERLYRTLNDHTSERLSQFVESNTYLTQRQEHDLAALTARYVSQLDTSLAHGIVKEDLTISDTERDVLLAAIELFRNSISSTCAALGNPRWVEDSKSSN